MHIAPRTEPRIPVLICTDGIFPHTVGGMQRHSRNLILSLAEHAELDLTVVHPHMQQSVFGDRRIREIRLPEYFEGRYLSACRRYSRAVLEAARQHPEAIIYAQGISVWKGCRELGPRMILNPHGLESFQPMPLRDRPGSLPFRFIFRHLFRHAGKVISLGGKLTDILHREVGPDRTVVIPNAAFGADFAPRHFGNAGLRLLFVGRFEGNKGIPYLLQAMEGLLTEFPPGRVRLDLVGDGSLLPALRERYAQAGIVFHGRVSDDSLHELYRQADVFVLPTLYEGMPTVVLEAMSHGLPVMVTDVGATREMVDADTGWIIRRKSAADIVRVVGDLLRDPASADLKGKSERAQQRFNSRFTWERTAAAHVALFREVYAEMNALRVT